MKKRAVEIFGQMSNRLSLEEYNYDHFTSHEAQLEAKKTFKGEGIGPGCAAPDFELKDTDGAVFRFGDTAGKPVLLRFGSFT